VKATSLLHGATNAHKQATTKLSLWLAVLQSFRGARATTESLSSNTLQQRPISLYPKLTNKNTSRRLLLTPRTKLRPYNQSANSNELHKQERREFEKQNVSHMDNAIRKLIVIENY
jgi:hypothetical protein